MELRKGYKATEVGAIPKVWQLKNIAATSTLKARIGWQGLTTSEYLSIGDYFLVTGTDFFDGKIKWETCHYVNKDRFIQDKNIQVKLGDILITKDGTIGKVAYVDILPLDATLNSGVFVIRPRDNSYDPLYCYYIFNSTYFDDFLRKLVAGSTINHLYQKDFVLFNFPLPPTKTEQTAIANALNDADSLISSIGKLIEKKRNIKQGAMQELLKPKKGWGEMTVGEICVQGGIVRGPFGGALKKESFVDKGFKVYEQKNAIYQSVLLGNYYVDYSKFNELKRFEIKERDFIISCSGTIGKIFQIPKVFEKGIINQALLKLTIDNNKFSENYFYHYFSWENFQAIIIDSTQGGAMKNLIGMSEFRKTIIPAPQNLNEQKGIAKILSDMDNEIISLEKKLSKSKMLKQGMMQELLTGRIRLV